VTPDEHVAALRRETAAFVLAAAGADLDAPVPSCPDWRLRDLVHHVAGVHAFWLGTLRAAIAGGGAAAGPVDELRRALPPVSEVTVEDLELGAFRLADLLDDADPALAVWNWSGADQTAAWVARRMAHETAVHRVDAELAIGTEAPAIDADLATDGVLEIGEVFLASIVHELDREQRAALHLGGTILLRAHDVPGTGVRFVADGATDTFLGSPAERGESADCLVTGSASDLALFLWDRADVADGGRFTVSGDAGLLERWRALPIFD
jgi:uncharacterized protein (TIGR03083 family)